MRLHYKDQSVFAVLGKIAVYYENANSAKPANEWIFVTSVGLEDVLRFISIPVSSIKTVSNYSEWVY
jgi:hypothetical protein